MSKEIPKSVLNEAQHLIRIYGSNIDLLGFFNGIEYYVYKFPVGTLIGYPLVYAYNCTTEETLEISGPRALDIIVEFSNC